MADETEEKDLYLGGFLGFKLGIFFKQILKYQGQFLKVLLVVFILILKLIALQRQEIDHRLVVHHRV
jgi:hypothetical protein